MTEHHSNFKVGNEFLPFHHQASHVSPDWRDGWNACYQAAIASREPQWLPIESAPKDGSFFLGYISAEKYTENDEGVACKDASCVEICWWQKSEGYDGYPDCGLFPLSDNMQGGITHWMPLPKPPKD